MTDILTASGFLAFFAEAEEDQIFTVTDPSHCYYQQKVVVRAEREKHCMIHPLDKPNPVDWRWCEMKALRIEH